MNERKDQITWTPEEALAAHQTGEASRDLHDTTAVRPQGDLEINALARIAVNFDSFFLILNRKGNLVLEGGGDKTTMSVSLDTVRTVLSEMRVKAKEYAKANDTQGWLNYIDSFKKPENTAGKSGFLLAMVPEIAKNELVPFYRLVLNLLSEKYHLPSHMAEEN